jgi:hypothetical protein
MKRLFIVSSTSLLLLVLLVIFALTSVAAFAQQPDPAFFGVWKLDIGKSSFGGQAPPTGAKVTIVPSGWVYATITSRLELEAIAVTSGHDGACIVIGLPPEYSCEQKSADPRHTVWTLKSMGTVVQVSEIELLADNKTIKSTSKHTTAEGAAYSTETIWNKVQASMIKK